MAITHHEFDYIRRLVRKRSAVVLEPGKEYLVESRLSMLVSRKGFATLHHLIKGVATDPSSDLERKVVEAMITDETSFFRDLKAFEILRTSVSVSHPSEPRDSCLGASSRLLGAIATSC